MESKEKFLGAIRELNDDEKVVKASTWELNARLRYESDLAYAKEQGIEQGIEKGIEQGVEKGSENKVKEVIISMLKEKVDYNLITKVTGKTIEEIKEIEKTI